MTKDDNMKIKIADAHCDTLTEFPENPFHSDRAVWSSDKFRAVGGVLQYMAVCTYPDHSGDSALRYAIYNVANCHLKKDKSIALLEKKEDFRTDKLNILLSLEGASPIINDIANLYAFYKLGVRAMGLTWNHRNYVGDGVDNNFGLTEFGKEVLKEMEKLSMIIDVSHLSDAGFEDVCKTIDSPFIASHSNAYSICEHKRNLKDEQILEIVRRKGFIGLNFYATFISNEASTMKTDFVRHVEHFLNLGAEDVLGFGADFDGMSISPFPTCESYIEVYHLLKESLRLTDELLEKIFFKNLLNFTLQSLK